MLSARRCSATARYWGSDDFVQPNASPSASGLPYRANIPNTTIVETLSPRHLYPQPR